MNVLCVFCLLFFFLLPIHFTVKYRTVREEISTVEEKVKFGTMLLISCYILNGIIVIWVRRISCKYVYKHNIPNDSQSEISLVFVLSICSAIVTHSTHTHTCENWFWYSVNMHKTKTHMPSV